jgi:hypothetical protein
LIFKVSTNRQEEAIKLVKVTDTNLIFGLCNLNICQRNAEVISRIAKSIYSCKNLVYKGRKRTEIVKMTRSGKDEKKEKGVEKISSRFEVENFRIICFDSANMEKERKKTSFFDPKKSSFSKHPTFRDRDKHEFDLYDENIDNIIYEEAGDQDTELLFANDQNQPINNEQNRHFKDKFVPNI